MDVLCHSVNDSVVLDDPSAFKSAVLALICALVKRFPWLKANIYTYIKTKTVVMKCYIETPLSTSPSVLPKYPLPWWFANWGAHPLLGPGIMAVGHVHYLHCRVLLPIAEEGCLKMKMPNFSALGCRSCWQDWLNWSAKQDHSNQGIQH